MARGDATSADIPGRFDLVVNGKGYMLLQSLEPSLPFRTHRAMMSFTPTFLERTNISLTYGDNTQDFFLTGSQVDWSEGESQRFFRIDDVDSARRYWTGSNIDPVSLPGQTVLRNTMASLAFSEAVRAVVEINTGTAGVYTVGTSSLAFTNSSGVITNDGAHGVGATPSQWGLATDSKNVYISTTSGGTVGVRKWNGSVFSTFSATGADSLCFLNNTLFGYQESTATLLKYDASGNTTTIFTWKDAAGSALTGSSYGTRLRANGGRLTMLRKTGVRGRGEIWDSDGSTVEQLAELPANFVAQDMEIAFGITFVSGYLSRNSDLLPAIYYFANSTLGLLWQSNISGYTNTTWPGMAAYAGGLLFTDDSTGKLMEYNVAIGGVHSVGTYTVTNATPMMAASKDFILHTRNSTTAYYYPTTTVASSGTLQTSIFDFNNSLTKIFRSIKVDWASFAGDAGASIDLAYQIDSLDGSYSSLANSVVSGTEYLLPTNTLGRGITVKATLNKNSSTSGPILKRVYIRAAPQLQTYRTRTFVLDLSGIGTVDNPILHDGLPHPLSGHEQAENLFTAISSTTPIQISDRFCNLQTSLGGSTTTDSYTGICEPAECEIYDTREGDDNSQFPGSFVAKITVREV